MMQKEWHSPNILPTMVHGRGKSKSTKEVLHDARRVALTMHITHYGPQELSYLCTGVLPYLCRGFFS